MRFSSTTVILLFTIHTIKSSEDAGFAIKEVSNEIKNVPQFAENSFLEHELLNGKMTPMDLMEKILGQKVDQNGLDEYSKMDISNGIKEQNELMDLFEKAKNSETSDKDKQDIGDGIDQLEGIKDLNSVINTVKNRMITVVENVKDITRTVQIFDTFEHESMRDGMRIVEHVLRTRLNDLKNLPRKNWWKRSELQSRRDEISKDLKKFMISLRYASDVIGFRLDNLKFRKYSRIGFQIEKVWTDIPTFGFVSTLIEPIGKLNEHTEKMKTLSNLSVMLSQIEVEMKVLEALRDSQTLRDISIGFKKLEKDYELTKGFKLSGDVVNKYQKISTASQFLQKLETLAFNIKRVELSTPVLMKKGKSLISHFENQNIPSGSLSENLNGLKSCLDQYDFSTEFIGELTELNQIVQLLEDPLKKVQSSFDGVNNYWLKWKNFEPLHNAQKVWFSSNTDNLEEVLEVTMYTIDESDFERSLEFFKGMVHRPGAIGQITILENYVYEAQENLRSLPQKELDELEKVSQRIVTKIAKVEQLLSCYSDLNVVPSDIKSLIDLPKKVWNFDPKQMENTVAVVDSLKEANKMMNELKNWKFDSNPLFNEFPLNSEDVQGILNGFESLKSIQNIQNNWIKMTNLDYLQNEKSDIKNGWNEMMTSLENFIEQLSQMETHSKLSDIQLLISKIQFPSDLQIDLIIDFINEKYQGNDRNGILNILEDVKNLQKDFPSYSSKLQKMNESIEKLKKWMKEEPVDKEEEPKIDCFENPSCPDLLTLSGAIPENSV